MGPRRGRRGVLATRARPQRRGGRRRGRYAERGVERVIVAHADLPLATHLGWVGDFDGVTLVPDRRDDGTNVICVPAGSGFGFAYGPGSFGRHHAEAERLGLPVRVVRERRLGWDVDHPADLDLPLDLLPTRE